MDSMGIYIPTRTFGLTFKYVGKYIGHIPHISTSGICSLVELWTLGKLADVLRSFETGL